jgi:hypothetical protein
MNLLPTEQRKRVRLLICYQNIIFSGLVLVLLVLVLILFLGAGLIFLNLEYQIIEDKIAIEQSRVIQTETVKGMERKVKELNKELAELRQTQDKQSNLYQILDNISQKLLQGVEIYNLEINRESSRVMVSGFSPTRDKLLRIKQILETTSEYENIDFPLSNLTDPKDIKFYFSFTLQLE